VSIDISIKIQFPDSPGLWDDITNLVIFSTAKFESQMSAMPGTFEFAISDRSQNEGFVTGSQIRLYIDGEVVYGGYVTQVGRAFAFPVVDTTEPTAVDSRQWLLRGVDYNTLFDRRVTYDADNPLSSEGLTYPKNTDIGASIRRLCRDLLILPSDLDYTTYVPSVIGITDVPEAAGAYLEQGSKWRDQMDEFAAWGIVYYINAAKQLVVKKLEDFEARWQFSDVPNDFAIPPGYEWKPTIGMREFSVTEDATMLINDAFIWGGSEWQGTGSTVLGRATNDESVALHNLWQYAETHFAETGFKLQSGVDARASVIVNGAETGIVEGHLPNRGASNPQAMIRCAWFDHNIPVDPGTQKRAWLVPGMLMTFILYSLRPPGKTAFATTLPLRSQTISFPSIDSTTGKPIVRFDGFFSLQLQDWHWLWVYLRTKKGLLPGLISAGITSVGQPLAPAPDGANKTFYFPSGFISGSSEVYVNGVRYFMPNQYVESNAEIGEILFNVAPPVGAQIFGFADVTTG